MRKLTVIWTSQRKNGQRKSKLLAQLFFCYGCEINVIVSLEEYGVAGFLGVNVFVCNATD